MKQSVLDREEKAQGRFEGEALSPLELSDVEVKRILVAVDFSEGSRQALEYGASLAKKFGAEVLLMHVFERVPGELKILEAAFVDTSFRDQAQENLAEWRKELQMWGVEAKALFCEGNAVYREIVEAALRNKAQLIVIGRHGVRTIERLLSRDVVSKVLKFAACPVVVGG